MGEYEQMVIDRLGYESYCYQIDDCGMSVERAKSLFSMQYDMSLIDSWEDKRGRHDCYSD